MDGLSSLLMSVTAVDVQLRDTLKPDAVLVEYVPSPKLHRHAVGPLVDLSVKVTVTGAYPDVGVPEKSAAVGFAVI